MITTDRLIELMERFINTQNTTKNEHFISDKDMGEHILIKFAEFLGKNLEEKSSTTKKENLP